MTLSRSRLAAHPLALRERLTRMRFRRQIAIQPVAHLVTLGNPGTDWTVPLWALSDAATCYAVGVGTDTSFDEALARRGHRVLCVDPTPAAIEHFESSVAPELGIELAPYALWTKNERLRFFSPENENWVSHSLTKPSDAYIEVEARTLDGIMAEHGDRHVELLKLDIEGAEYAVLEALDLRALGVRVLCVEFHDAVGLRAMLRSVRALTRAGYLPVFSRLTDVTFVRDDVLSAEPSAPPH
ncbi:FkbM family methyltransferase [Patulibacter sp. S7RM1-6]